MTEQEPEVWSFNPPDGKAEGYWFVQYKKSTPPTYFFIEINDELIFVQILFDELRPHAGSWLGLYRTLLRLNEELALVKFGLDARNRIVLLGELPTNDFTLDMFQNLLRLMAHYHAELYWEINLVAEDESLAQQLVRHEAQLALFDQQQQGLIKRLQASWR